MKKTLDGKALDSKALDGKTLDGKAPSGKTPAIAEQKRSFIPPMLRSAIGDRPKEMDAGKPLSLSFDKRSGFSFYGFVTGAPRLPKSKDGAQLSSWTAGKVRVALFSTLDDDSVQGAIIKNNQIVLDKLKKNTALGRDTIQGTVYVNALDTLALSLPKRSDIKLPVKRPPDQMTLMPGEIIKINGAVVREQEWMTKTTKKKVLEQEYRCNTIEDLGPIDTIVEDANKYWRLLLTLPCRNPRLIQLKYRGSVTDMKEAEMDIEPDHILYEDPQSTGNVDQSIATSEQSATMPATQDNNAQQPEGTADAKKKKERINPNDPCLSDETQKFLLENSNFFVPTFVTPEPVIGYLEQKCKSPGFHYTYYSTVVGYNKMFDPNLETQFVYSSKDNPKEKTPRIQMAQSAYQVDYAAGSANQPSISIQTIYVCTTVLGSGHNLWPYGVMDTQDQLNVLPELIVRTPAVVKAFPSIEDSLRQTKIEGHHFSFSMLSAAKQNYMCKSYDNTKNIFPDLCTGIVNAGHRITPQGAEILLDSLAKTPEIQKTVRTEKTRGAQPPTAPMETEESTGEYDPSTRQAISVLNYLNAITMPNGFKPILNVKECINPVSKLAGRYEFFVISPHGRKDPDTNPELIKKIQAGAFTRERIQQIYTALIHDPDNPIEPEFYNAKDSNGNEAKSKFHWLLFAIHKDYLKERGYANYYGCDGMNDVLFKDWEKVLVPVEDQQEDTENPSLDNQQQHHQQQQQQHQQHHQQQQQHQQHQQHQHQHQQQKVLNDQQKGKEKIQDPMDEQMDELTGGGDDVQLRHSESAKSTTESHRAGASTAVAESANKRKTPVRRKTVVVDNEQSLSDLVDFPAPGSNPAGDAKRVPKKRKNDTSSK